MLLFLTAPLPIRSQLCSTLNTPTVSYISSTQNDDREQHLQRCHLLPECRAAAAAFRCAACGSGPHTAGPPASPHPRPVPAPVPADCVPVCPSNSTRIGASSTGVTCASCPANYVAIPGRGCYAACGGAYPVAFDTTPVPVCSQACPAVTPISVSSTQCKDAAGKNYRVRVKGLGVYGWLGGVGMQESGRLYCWVRC